MTARHPTQWYLLVFGLVFLGTSGARLFSFLRERSDIWWTPPAMAVPLNESKDRVQVLVQGVELQEVMSTGRLRLVPPPFAATLAPIDFSVRFNNWDRVRAERLPGLLIAAATAGSAATLLLFWFVLWQQRRKDEGQV
jgi:hypothetical protein